MRSMVGGWLLGLVLRCFVRCDGLSSVCVNGVGCIFSSYGVVDVGFDRVGCDPGLKVHLVSFSSFRV